MTLLHRRALSDTTGRAFGVRGFVYFSLPEPSRGKRVELSDPFGPLDAGALNRKSKTATTTHSNIKVEVFKTFFLRNQPRQVCSRDYGVEQLQNEGSQRA